MRSNGKVVARANGAGDCKYFVEKCKWSANVGNVMRNGIDLNVKDVYTMVQRRMLRGKSKGKGKRKSKGKKK